MSDKTIKPIVTDSVFVTQRVLAEAAAPIIAVMNQFKSATAPLESISKAISNSLITYKDFNFNVGAANSIGNLFAAASQIQKAFYSPMLDSLADLSKQMEAHYEKRQALRRMIIGKWNALNIELMNTNRYFPNTEFIDIFSMCIKDACFKFRSSRILYRAREISENCLPEAIQKAAISFDEANNDYTSNSSASKTLGFWEFLNNMSQDEWEELVYKNSLNDIIFWGYEENDSDAPQKSPSHGRINPKGISYLYTSLDAKTAISEIQPTNKELVSVAKIRTKKQLKLFSLDFYESFSGSALMKQPLSEFKSITGMTFWELQVFFDTLSELFSKPALRNEDNYYATQYLGEYIKSKGFDGIKFKSSLKKGGYNIVLFDTSRDEKGNPMKYEIIESHLFLVKNVNVTSARVMPKSKIK